MYAYCTYGRHHGVIVYLNRHGDRMCQGCLEGYLRRRRVEAGLEAPPEPVPALPPPLPPVVDGRVPRPEIPRLVHVGYGTWVMLDGRIPERMRLGGRWYDVCLNPHNENGNSHGHESEAENQVTTAEAKA